MKINKIVLKVLLLPLMLMAAKYVYSGNVESCTAIVEHFNKSALAALFDNKQNKKIILTSSSSQYTEGGFVRTQISYTIDAFNQVSKDIGSIRVYSIGDGRAIFEEQKQFFMPPNAKLQWQNVLPNVVEGYVSKAMQGYLAFNAYLTNGDYVIFIYQDKFGNPSTENLLSQPFIDYINVMASQVISALK